VNGVKVAGESVSYSSADLVDGALFLRAGKKRVCRIIVGGA